MPKRSKRYSAARAKVDRTKVYSLAEAIPLIVETSTTSFDSSLELHIKLGIDPKKGDQLVRGVLSLPHGTGKTKKILALTATRKDEAIAAGAAEAGGEELIEKIRESGKCAYDVVVVEPALMTKVAQIAKILGPKGLMPSPKNDTVSDDIGRAVKELAGGKVAYRNDDSGNVHVTIGKASFGKEKLFENATALLQHLKQQKPETAKGVFVRSVFLSSSMGPSVKVTL